MFQIDREIFENNIWQNPAEFRLFFYILGNAVWKEEGVKFGNVLVKRGQYLRSYRNLRNDLMYSENNAIKYYSLSHIKKLTDKLVNDGRIEKEETELGTLFTITNYSKYQGFERFEIIDQEQGKNAERTQKERSENNKKKDNKDNNISIYSIFDSYSENKDLRQALRDYSLMRNKIKAPLTERAVTMLLNKLDSLASTDELKIKLLDQAILSNWKSVFPLKGEQKQQQPKQQSKNKFHNFIQNDSDDVSLDEIADKRREEYFKERKVAENV